MLKRINYDDRQHLVYVRGRALPLDVVAAWMSEFARHSPPRRPLTVLDLGSGTGRFSPALADTFGGPVYGVEPSARMRQVAANTAAHPSVTYLQGSAEQIPLPDDHCDLILLYLVIHHIQDLPAAAPEISRVLAPGGRLLIRNAFADRMPDPLWHRWFPRARAIEEELFPTVAGVVDAFATVDLRPVALTSIRHRLAASHADYAARLRLRASSVFDHMTEQEIAEGFATMDADLAAHPGTGPVEEDCDLLTLAVPAT
ncbi:class I SAM-dependent methyltransferase [Nonomuraea sp. NPDC051941]|uniref:class I SAM-dependent methyltransferase n=1 Tax=Nonomuraea sp. NPDC051941 TaxID=3364373 RepID=UPI0037C95C5E